ncbi:hypothetical protein NQ315_002475, partial [Exocentrus adspersus]
KVIQIKCYGLLCWFLIGLLNDHCFCAYTQTMHEHFQWNILDYEYPNEYLRDRALLTGKFRPRNNLPVGIEIWNDKVFVTVPRWREGIPSTLNYVPINSPVKNPRLIPYPSWEMNELGNCDNGLSTVYRIHADKCDRLWVLDTGTFGIGNTTQNPCPYAINIFDLKTDTRIRRYEFKPQDINSRTFIANIAVDLVDSNDCDKAFAYFTDELGYGLIVYSYAENRSWRFEHGYFMPDPLRGDFTINKLNFQWQEEGVFGMSLSPIQHDGYRLLFFSPLASYREFVVSTEILRNSSKVEDGYKDFYPLQERGPNSHTTARVMDENGIQFFNLIDQNAIGCWNSKTEYHPLNLGLVFKDDVKLIFPADVKVDRYHNLWVSSDRMSDFLLSDLNFRDINFRIFFAPISVLIQNTPCNDYSYTLNSVFPEKIYNNIFLK